MGIHAWPATRRDLVVLREGKAEVQFGVATLRTTSRREDGCACVCDWEFAPRETQSVPLWWEDRDPSVGEEVLPLLMGPPGVRVEGHLGFRKGDGGYTSLVLSGWKPCPGQRLAPPPHPRAEHAVDAHLVRWFHEKGFGFARTSKEEVFVHVSERLDGGNRVVPTPGMLLRGVVGSGRGGKGTALRDWEVPDSEASLLERVCPRVEAFLKDQRRREEKASREQAEDATWLAASNPSKGTPEARATRLEAWVNIEQRPTNLLLQELFASDGDSIHWSPWAKAWRWIARGILLGWTPLDSSGYGGPVRRPAWASSYAIERAVALLDEKELERLGLPLLTDAEDFTSHLPAESWATLTLRVAGASWQKTREEEFDYVSNDERGMRTAVYLYGVWTFTLDNGEVVSHSVGGDTESCDWSNLASTLRRKVYSEAKQRGYTRVHADALTRVNKIQEFLKTRTFSRGKDSIAGVSILVPGEALDRLRSRIAEQIAAAEQGATPQPDWEPEALERVARPLLEADERWHRKLYRLVGGHTDLFEGFRRLDSLLSEGSSSPRDKLRRMWWSVIQRAPKLREENEQLRAQVEAVVVERTQMAEAERRAEKARLEAEQKATLEAEVVRLGTTVQVRHDLPWILLNLDVAEAEAMTGLAPSTGIGPERPPTWQEVPPWGWATRGPAFSPLGVALVVGHHLERRCGAPRRR